MYVAIAYSLSCCRRSGPRGTEPGGALHIGSPLFAAHADFEVDFIKMVKTISDQA